MTKIFLSSLLFLISMFMLFLNHPLSMGLLILVQTLILCLMSGMMIKTYWFSYILFLTFLGGLLVLFIYVSSIASNELFSSMNNKIKMFMMFSVFFLLVLQFFLYENLNWMNLSNDIMENNNFFNIYFFNNENKININKIYNTHNFMLMMMMVIYLFIALIAIVKITNIFYGPLRSFN